MRGIFEWLASRTRQEILGLCFSCVIAGIAGVWALATFEPERNDAEHPEASASLAISPTNRRAIERRPNASGVVPRAKPSAQINMIYDVCVGEYESRCERHTAYTKCGGLNAWARKTCGKFIATVVETKPGHKCGYSIVLVACSVGQ
jgi:hypothetical protein